MSEGKSILPASSVDRRLVRAAASFNKTPEQLSEAVLGQLSPAQAEARLHEILSSVSILDEIGERRLLLIQMAEHLEFLRSQRENPKSWNALSRMYKLLSDQIERANINVNDISTKLATEHARVYVEGFMLGLTKVFEALSEKGVIDIPEEDVQELAEVGIGASSEYLERFTAREIDASP